MQKPCVLVELDPSALERGRTVLTAALSLFHTDVEVVITLTGVTTLDEGHGDAITRMCLEISDGAPLPDIALETTAEAANRVPLVSVRADDDPVAVVESIVLLSSIALRNWDAQEYEGATATKLSSESPIEQHPEVAEWVAQRDALIKQRDCLVPKSAPIGFAAVVTSVADVLNLDGVMRNLTGEGREVHAVSAAAGAKERAVSRELRSRGWGAPKQPRWLAARLSDVRRGLMTVFYAQPDSELIPADISPVRAAEYGVRVVCVVANGTDLSPSAPLRQYDSPQQRVAWRIFPTTPRAKELYKLLLTGDAPVRYVGSPATDLALASVPASSQTTEGRGQQKTILWVPMVWTRGGSSDIRLLTDRMARIAEANDGLSLIVHLDERRRRDLERLGAGDPAVALLREAANRLANVEIQENEDVTPLLSRADAVVTDINGPVVEAIALDRPVFYTFRDDVDALPRGAGYLLGCALGRDGEGLEEFVKMIAGGRDPWRQSRRAVRETHLEPDDGTCAERIADDVVFSARLERGGQHSRSGLLSVAMIVKDEAENLPAALESIARLGECVAETCIYDTGSNDETVSIARAAGAKVVEGYWDGDFSRARNAAIDMCSSRWVLILDADEQVVANPNALGRILSQALTAEASSLDVLNLMVTDVSASGGAASIWPSRRILRPTRAWYQGKVHEDIFRRNGSLVRAVTLDPKVVRIEHRGYVEPELVQEKLRRNRAIADAAVEAHSAGNDGEAHIRALVDRARSSVGLGDIDSAFEDFDAIRRLPTTRSYRWWGMEQFGDLLLQNGQTERAKEVLRELQDEDDTTPFVEWLRAGVLRADGAADEAFEVLSRIEILTDSLGLRQRETVLLAAKMRTAVEAGLFDEAIANLIPLMATHGVVSGYGPILLRLWGNRPLGVLAQLIVEADAGHSAAMVDELAAIDAQGSQVAALVQQLGGARM